MRVFEILGDGNNYRHLLMKNQLEGGKAQDSPLWFDGTPRESLWTPPEMMVMSPKKPAPDIWNVQHCQFAASPGAFEKVQEFFEMAGEVLPLPHGGHVLQLLNVTVCEECLDYDKCHWMTRDGDDPTRWRISRLKPDCFAFDTKSFPESSIFKIPQAARGMSLCWEEDDDPMCSFKAAVEHSNLTGLEFRELWSG